MNILVAGGCGYLGGHLSLTLTDRNHKCDILDPAWFYDGYLDDGYVIVKDSLQKGLSLGDYDVLVICCYEELWLQNNKSELKFNFDNFKNIDRVIYIADWQSERQYQEDLIKTLSGFISNLEVIRVGDVWGEFSRVRFDTYVNKLILSFMSENQYVSPNNGRFFVPIVHIDSFSHKLSETIEGKFNHIIHDNVVHWIDFVFSIKSIYEKYSQESCTVYFTNDEPELMHSDFNVITSQDFNPFNYYNHVEDDNSWYGTLPNYFKWMLVNIDQSDEFDRIIYRPNIMYRDMDEYRNLLTYS